MNKNRIPRPSKSSSGIPVKPPTEDGCLRFSFKYMTVPSNGKFSLADRETKYFTILLDRFKDLSNFSCGSFRAGARGGLRNHPLRFGNDKSLTESGFTCLNSDLREQVEHAAFQFSLSQHEHGRVHGFFIDDVFFIVWLDPRHELDQRRY